MTETARKHFPDYLHSVMLSVPAYIHIIFIATTIVTLILLFRAMPRIRIWIPVLWLAAQGGIAASGFYADTASTPPRFLLMVVPPLLVILLLFVTRRGRSLIDSASIQGLTLLQSVRIPVELVLFLLYRQGAVPGLMTFEGRNFDVVSGITALIIYYLMRKNRISRAGVIVWNLACIILLFNIVINAALSAPSPVQQFAFDQPNIVVLHFPFCWLPSFIVPVALLAHLVSLRKLFFTKSHSQ